MAATIDGAAATQFKATLARYICASATSGTLTTNGTFAGTSTGNLNLYHLRQLRNQLKKWNVKPFDDGSYACIASVAAIDGIQSDTSTGAWIDANRYAGSKRLFTGEVGQLMGVRFIEDTAVMSNAVGNGSAYGEAVIFGRDTVMEGVALAEQIRVDTPKDFGRDRGVCWYWLGGFKLVWDVIDVAKGWTPRIIYLGSQ
mgnify:CR=1 FL=1